MKRYAFLYNPAAKGGASTNKIEQLRTATSEFDEAKLFISSRLGDISEFIDNHFDEYDVFIACGGDGTVREVAGKLLNTQKKMGIVPMGTGNDLCKTLKIPISINDSISLIKADNVSRIDVGKCNDFIFLNTLGFGFDGLTNRYALGLRHLPSILTYAISAFKAIRKHIPFQVVISKNGQSFAKEVIMLTLANGRVEGGSFWIAPTASVLDGKLSMVTIKPISKWVIPILLPLFLIKKPYWIPCVSTEEVDEVSLKVPENIDIHADGEIIENDTDKYSIRLANNSLRVICGLE